VLTPEQEAKFRLFGFEKIEGAFSADEMAGISHDFDEVLAECRNGEPFPGQERQLVTGFVEKRASLTALVEDDRIYGPVEQLIGEPPLWIESDGNLYVGDTYWHPDGRVTRPLWIKVALYLDPLTSETGSLRVIPGSHLALFSSALEAANLRGPTGGSCVGLTPRDIPSYPIETQPGDVVFFDQRTWHSSFGGITGRRMFTMNYATPIKNEIERQQFVDVYEHNKTYSPIGEVYSESFLNSDHPRIQVMTRTLRELGLK
jgi:hypothetical protein